MSAELPALAAAPPVDPSVARALDDMADGLVVLDRTGRCRYANRRARTLLGQPGDALIGASLDEAFSVDGEVRRACIEAMQDGVPVQTEARIAPSDRWIEARVQPGADGAVVTLADVTERRRAADALAERARSFEALADHLPDVVARIDEAGRHRYVNRVVSSATGLPAAAFLDRTHAELRMPHEIVAAWEQGLSRAFATWRPASFEIAYPSPDGTRQYEITLIPEGGPHLGVEGGRVVLAVGHDVTDVRAAERELRASEARFRSRAEASAQIVWRSGPAGEPVDDGIAWAELTGRHANAGTATPERFPGLTQVHPEDVARVRADWQHALETGERFEAQFRVRDRAGAWRVTVGRGVPVRDRAGHVVEWVGTHTDVTAHVEMATALRERERQLVTLLSNLPGVAYRVWMDEDWTAEFFSEGARELTGWAAADFVGTPRITLEALTHPDDRGRVRREIQAAVAAERPFQLTYRIVTADGRVKWVWEQGRVVQRAGDTGLPVLEGLLVDVTEREEAIAAVREAQRIGRLGSWSCDARTGRMLVSTELADLLGYPRGPRGAAGVESSIAEFEALLPPAERRARRDRLRDVHARRAPSTHARMRLESPDGGWRAVDLRAEWTYDADGQPLAASGTMQDVTEIVMAEDALRLAHEQQLALLESIPDEAWLQDLTGRYVAVNAAYARGVGCASDAIVGRSTTDVHGIEVARRIEAQERAAVEAGCAQVHEYQSVGRDGAVRWMETVIAPYRGAAGQVAGTVGITRDITERRRMAEQLRQAQKMEALGLLAGSIAHDFNNLLSAIIGGAELARREVPDGSVAAEDMDDVRQAATRGAQLTRQLLAFSRQSVQRPRALDLNDLVQESAKLLRRLLPEHVALDLGVSGGACVVRADSGELEQVLVNLVVNARDAVVARRASAPTGAGASAEPGVVSLETASLAIADGDPRLARELGTHLPGGRYAALTVRDTGIGMDAATRARIFEPFFTTKPAGEGTGLGLATVFGIVGQSGGTVHVQSAPGAGATFTVLLPLIGTAAEGLTVGGHAPRGGTESVLLVEDEAVVRTTARRILERNGYRVVDVRHGDDALLAWDEQRGAFDVLVTDLRMPVMGGQELVAALRARCPDLAVVVMSGYASGKGPAEAALLQAEVFLAKPFSIESLLERVRDALDRRVRG